MWHRVAALLGGRTVVELQAVMSSAEFSDWCAFYALEPWGSEAENWRMAVVAATTANYSGRLKKPLRPKDFLPRGEHKARRQTPEEMRQIVQSMVKNDG